jgi:hypothetical protein
LSRVRSQYFINNYPVVFCSAVAATTQSGFLKKSRPLSHLR